MDDAWEHDTEQTQHSSPCPEADFSMWDLSHTLNKCFIVKSVITDEFVT